MLPSGRTLRGGFGWTAQTGVNSLSGSGLTYPFPLDFSPAVTIVEAGQGAPPQCPGNFGNPQALPGALCVYVRVATHTDGVDWYGMTDDASNPRGGARFGIVLYVRQTSTDRSDVAGTWAVTAS